MHQKAFLMIERFFKCILYTIFSFLIKLLSEVK